MKILTAILLLLSTNSIAFDVEMARDLLSKASTSETANKKLISHTENFTLQDNTLYYAFHAAGVMSMANHVYWPTTKYNYFLDGKKMLEKAVNYDLKNVEIRFIRFSVQSGTPTLVGYKANMEEDKAYIKKHIDETNWTKAYKLKVQDFLNNN